MFRAASQPKKKYGLVGNSAAYIITDENANSEFQVILDVGLSHPTNNVFGLFLNAFSAASNLPVGTYFSLFHAYSAFRMFRYGQTQNENHLISADRHIVVFDSRSYSVDGVLVSSFPAIEPPMTFPRKILIGKSHDTRCWNGHIYGAKLLIGGVLKHDFIPVPTGNTDYSSVPAPSNCMWDTVTQKYFETAGGGAFGIVEDVE